MRHVKGVLFLDYVRMLRTDKQRDWRTHLTDEDLPYLAEKIDPRAWYPMATFERMGTAILETIARGELFPVQLWGRYSAAQLHVAHPQLLAPGEPVETLQRFSVLRETFFDFQALDVLLLHDDEAQIEIGYHMGMPAEEAASVQTLGFFEGLLDLAGAKSVRGELAERAWAGDARTRLDLHWTPPPLRN